MKNTFLSILALSTLLLAAPAFADATPVTPTASTLPTFSGPYAGVEGGVSSLAPVRSTPNNLALVYDGLVGYNYAFNNGWVTGVEGTFGKKDTQNYTATLGGRVGHTLVSPTTLGYVKVAGVDTNLDANGTTGSLRGVEAGLGVETFVTHSVSTRLEGDYTDYLAHSFNGADVNPSDVAVKVAVVYHLN